MSDLYRTWGATATLHRTIGYLTCFTRAVNSCTRLYTDLSSRMRRAIFDVAWITVVWSRPPNSLPIFGNEESVSSRDRYIATWRGYTMFWERLSPQSSSSDMLKRSATRSWIRLIETSAASP